MEILNLKAEDAKIYIICMREWILFLVSFVKKDLSNKCIGFKSKCVKKIMQMKYTTWYSSVNVFHCTFKGFGRTKIFPATIYEIVRIIAVRNECYLCSSHQKGNS